MLSVRTSYTVMHVIGVVINCSLEYLTDWRLWTGCSRERLQPVWIWPMRWKCWVWRTPRWAWRNNAGCHDYEWVCEPTRICYLIRQIFGALVGILVWETWHVNIQVVLDLRLSNLQMLQVKERCSLLRHSPSTPAFSCRCDSGGVWYRKRCCILEMQKW